MSPPHLLLAVCFWASFAGVVYAYLGYPVAIWLLARWFGRRPTAPVVPDGELPTLSLLIAAYNEEDVIEERIRNALALDYPADKLEIVIACDGCSDSTPQIVRRFANQGVRLLDYEQRRGKAATLNAAFQEVRGELVMLSDANTNTDANAARQLARWFVDPQVGVVCGRLILIDPKTGINVDGLYWRYETFLKHCESRLGALLGANGGIYAIRRDLFQPIPADTLVDDFVIPLRAHLRSRCALVYDRDAVAHEETAPNVGAEFRRRARIGAGGFQSIGLLGGLLAPWRGWIAFSFLSHKVLRWLCPFFLIFLLLSNFCLLEGVLYQGTLLGQAALYSMALAGAWIPGRSKGVKVLRLSTLFTSMNLALLVGFWRWLRGLQKAAWERELRAWVRYPCQAQASFVVVQSADPTKWPGKVLNVSSHGIALLVDAPLTVGEQLRLELRGSHDELVLPPLASVVRVTEAADGEQVVGCNFHGELDEQEIKVLV